MKTRLEDIHVSSCRYRGVVWVLLFTFLCTLFPFPLHAQQPTATISSVTGIVLVNGQEQGAGTVLNARDMIETQVGTSIIITLSDGSILDVGEKTQIQLAELRQTATQVRVSRIKLMWGWMRARLSPGHQQSGSSFDIETPNAVIGVKFSQPDVEVSYNPSTQETIGLAHTVELMAKNLLTDEELLVPVGSSVIIVGTTIKLVAGIVGVIGTTGTNSTSAVSTGSTISRAESSGMGTGTKMALGVGAAAAVGGAIALVSSEGENGNNDLFTGTFKFEGNTTVAYGPAYIIATMVLTQTGDSVNGTYEQYSSACCIHTTNFTATGTVSGRSGILYLTKVAGEDCVCPDGNSVNGFGNQIGDVHSTDIGITTDGIFHAYGMDFIRQ